MKKENDNNDQNNNNNDQNNNNNNQNNNNNGQNNNSGELFNIDQLVKETNLSIYENAAIKRMKRWLPNKKVTKEEFNNAVQELKNRSIGGKV